MVFRREGAYAIASVLVILMVGGLLFASSAWSQDKNGDQKKDRKETRQDERIQDSSTRSKNNRAPMRIPTQTQQVGAQAVDAGVGVTLSKIEDSDPVEVNDLLLYTLQVTNTSGANNLVVVADNLPNTVDLELVGISGGTGSGECIETADEDDVYCEVSLAATGTAATATIQILVTAPNQPGQIDNVAQVFNAGGTCVVTPPSTTPSGCPAPAASVTEPTNVVNDQNRDNPRDRREQFRDFLRDNPFFRDDPFFDQYNDEGDLSQEEQYEDADNDLNDNEETTDEFADDDLDGDDGVSATADDGQAEASTPGAVASAGGDPDELEPLTSVPEGVEDEIPTSGPLPNTGGMSPLYWLLPLAGLLILAGLPVYRWAKRRE
jgi:hypothetical protein